MRDVFVIMIVVVVLPARPESCGVEVGEVRGGVEVW